MTLEVGLAIGLFLATCGTAGVGWYCRTLWARTDDLRAENVALGTRLAGLQLDCIERDGRIWAEFNAYRTHVAEVYTSKADLREMRDEIMGRFDRLDAEIKQKADR